MSWLSIPSDLRGTHVVMPLACRRCGYDLRGLRATGRCPECGKPVWESIQELVDPDASKLPRLRDPEGVGDGVFWMALCWTAAVFSGVLRPVALWIDSMSSQPGVTLLSYIPPWIVYLPGVLLLMSMWSVWKFWYPPREDESFVVRRAIWLLGLSTLFAGALTLVQAYAVLHDEGGALETGMRFAVPGAGIIALWSFRRIIRIIGQRSRQWRTARSGRQYIVGLIAALVLVIIGNGVTLLPEDLSPLTSPRFDIRELGVLMAATGLLMLLIGMAYLVVNAWWIRAALYRQPPDIYDLLMPPPPEPDA